ncbi:GDP-mannose 4,6-dehydratase [Curtobacterium sp. MCBA15_001]|uniref:GDP-mannose 4,6-dehydratase n=1 Tax=Curtobacterium sp. MCBA15_001 TaxID=1898731 RepID=UPI0008DD608A|nr:GDP-mannose 4,6-dehydratase [Curtobacterium sp. MCBA15_001]OIH97595.1 GDP-mannose 4,6 dehydratase [Curtobacterium sp. MCBA15_001]
MRTALVTGAAGQTGSYLGEQLVRAGWSVHGVVRDVDDVLPTGVHRHLADLDDHARITAIVQRLRPTAVVNLAAMSSVALSWTNPVATAQVNGTAVANLLHAVGRLAAEGAPVRFVQASSAEVFGRSAESPQDERTPIAPVNPYGAAKAHAHLLVQAHRAAGLHASNAILFNHESPRRPETFVTRKITSSVARIAAGLQDRLVLGDLTVRRDWGWAPDFADAIVRMVDSDHPDDYVVATGVSHSIQDFVQAAFAAAGIADWRDHVDTDAAYVRPADAAELRGDARKIRDALGWSPTVPFEDIVGRMLAHDQAVALSATAGSTR